MKDLRMLVWLTQLGLSVATPLVGFPLLALWLHDRFSMGDWIVWIGVALGIVSAIEGLRYNLRIMKQMSKNDSDPPPPSFNEHK